jgi:class 3 adenylate cyclase
MKLEGAKAQQTIIVFDLRNFSEHRSRLAEIGRAKRLTNFVKEILDSGVEFIEDRRGEFNLEPEPILNHTGDGFVLILRGDKNPLLGLLWISEFRQLVSVKIKEYQNQIGGLFPINAPKKLDFGIGAHYGLALPFRFRSFGNAADREGFIGSAINIASRVEQCTKDHVQKVLITGQLRKQVLSIIPKTCWAQLNPYCIPLGRHRLRGFENPCFLFGFKPGFHRTWKSSPD